MTDPAIADASPLLRATDAGAQQHARAPNGASPAVSPQGAGSATSATSETGETSDAGVTSAADADTAPAFASTTVVLLLADVAPASRLWGWSRLVRGPRALRGTPGLRFAKVLGSGAGGGFGLRPSASLQALFAVFDDDDAATAFVERSPQVHAYRERAREWLALRLAPYACRGSWDRASLAPSALAPSALAPAQGPIAALTRASIRVLAAPAFWRHAPPSQADLAQAAGCRLAIGLGEAPLLRQATFSLWDSAAAMDAYARSGAHLAAIRAAAARGFFSESMFVRFVLRAAEGTWQGGRHGLT